MAYLILLCVFILVMVFHVEFDKMQKALIEKIEESKREQASRSVDEFYNA